MKNVSLPTQKSSREPSCAADTEIFKAHRLLLAQKSLTKTGSLGTQKSSKKPTSTADAEIFKAHRLLPTQKLLMKTGSLNQKIIQEAQFNA